jgi:hypothetical protein
VSTSPAAPTAIQRIGKLNAWTKLARAAFDHPVQIEGTPGAWVSVSECRPVTTAHFHPTRLAAELAVERMEVFHCGGRCRLFDLETGLGNHYLVPPGDN